MRDVMCCVTSSVWPGPYHEESDGQTLEIPKGSEEQKVPPWVWLIWSRGKDTQSRQVEVFSQADSGAAWRVLSRSLPRRRWPTTLCPRAPQPPSAILQHSNSVSLATLGNKFYSEPECSGDLKHSNLQGFLGKKFWWSVATVSLATLGNNFFLTEPVFPKQISNFLAAWVFWWSKT